MAKLYGLNRPRLPTLGDVVIPNGIVTINNDIKEVGLTNRLAGLNKKQSLRYSQ
jgi:hypothetical protein